MTDDGALYDRKQALTQLAGNAALFAEIAAMLVAEGDSYGAALEAAWMSGDAAALQREAHTIKSVFASFACEHGWTLARRLENAAASGRLDGVPEQVAEVVAVLRSLMAELAADGGSGGSG